MQQMSTHKEQRILYQFDRLAKKGPLEKKRKFQEELPELWEGF